MRKGNKKKGFLFADDWKTEVKKASPNILNYVNIHFVKWTVCWKWICFSVVIINAFEIQFVILHPCHFLSAGYGKCLHIYRAYCTEGCHLSYHPVLESAIALECLTQSQTAKKDFERAKECRCRLEKKGYLWTTEEVVYQPTNQFLVMNGQSTF